MRRVTLFVNGSPRNGKVRDGREGLGSGSRRDGAAAAGWARGRSPQPPLRAAVPGAAAEGPRRSRRPFPGLGGGCWGLVPGLLRSPKAAHGPRCRSPVNTGVRLLCVGALRGIATSRELVTGVAIEVSSLSSLPSQVLLHTSSGTGEARQ